MRILSIDAATKGLSVAITEKDKLLAVSALNVGKTHSQRLIPLIDNLIKSGNLVLKDIDLVAVSIGPGSFTGLRIGISSAKAIAYALGVKIIGVKTLDALAWNCQGQSSIICPILDARRNEVYYGVYNDKAEQTEAISSMEPIALAEHLKVAYPAKPIRFLGDAADIYFEQMQQVLGANAKLAAPAKRVFMADSVGFYAHHHLEDAVLPHELKAFYLRPSEAERQRKKRLANAE